MKGRQLFLRDLVAYLRPIRTDIRAGLAAKSPIGATGAAPPRFIPPIIIMRRRSSSMAPSFIKRNGSKLFISMLPPDMIIKGRRSSKLDVEESLDSESKRDIIKSGFENISPDP